MGLVDDETDAIGGAAAARVVWPLGKREAVIVGKFLAASDIAIGDDPHATANGFGAAVGCAGMIDEPGDVAGLAAIDVMARVQIPDVNTTIAAGFETGETQLLAAVGFGFGDFLPDVFDDASALGDIDASVSAAAVNGGAANDQPGGFRASGVWHEETNFARRARANGNRGVRGEVKGCA